MRRHEAALTARGMVPGYLDSIATELGRYEDAVTAGQTGVQIHSGATKSLHYLGMRALVLIHQLDGIYTTVFADDVRMQAAWRVARDIPWRRGKRKAKGKTDAA